MKCFHFYQRYARKCFEIVFPLVVGSSMIFFKFFFILCIYLGSAELFIIILTRLIGSDNSALSDFTSSTDSDRFGIFNLIFSLTIFDLKDTIISYLAFNAKTSFNFCFHTFWRLASSFIYRFRWFDMFVLSNHLYMTFLNLFYESGCWSAVVADFRFYLFNDFVSSVFWFCKLR